MSFAVDFNELVMRLCMSYTVLNALVLLLLTARLAMLSMLLCVTYTWTKTW